ncbi:MAG: hypothetical protein ACPGJS_23845 [Flammeovirgaceae bacterium]
MIRELSEIEFNNYFNPQQVDVSPFELRSVYIWPYIQELFRQRVVEETLTTLRKITSASRTIEGTFEYITFADSIPNVTLIIVIDLIQEEIIGHYWANFENASAVDIDLLSLSPIA